MVQATFPSPPNEALGSLPQPCAPSAYFCHLGPCPRTPAAVGLNEHVIGWLQSHVPLLVARVPEKAKIGSLFLAEGRLSSPS